MKHKRCDLMGLVGGLDVVIAPAGILGGWMPPRDMIVWTFAVWILGATLLLVFTDPPDKC